MARKGSGSETRQTILNVSERLFAERGFYGTSLRDIGGEVGIANASLLYHFPSKGRIYSAVVGTIADSLAKVAGNVENAKGGENKKLKALYEGLFDWAQENPNHVRILMRELMDHVDQVEAMDRWFLTNFVERMSSMLARGRKSGAFRKVDSQLYLFNMLGSISFFALGATTLCAATGRDTAETIDQYRQEGFQQVERALLSKKKKK